MDLLAEVVRLVRLSIGNDIPVIAGGIIPFEDIDPLKEIGILDIFLPETPMKGIVRAVKDMLRHYELR
jgi:methylmalonyl-CoA mutase C-terminal domain/subunit